MPPEVIAKPNMSQNNRTTFQPFYHCFLIPTSVCLSYMESIIIQMALHARIIWATKLGTIQTYEGIIAV